MWNIIYSLGQNEDAWSEKVSGRWTHEQVETTEKPVLEIGDTMHPASKDNSEEWFSQRKVISKSTNQIIENGSNTKHW